MKIIGGPYDGMEIDHNDINLYATFVPMLPRKFVLMPPFADWEAVKREECEKNSGPLLAYEIFHVGNGAELRFAPAGEFDRAMKGVGNTPVPQVEFTGQYFQCCRGVDNLPSDYFDVVDEKDRVWQCVAITRQEGEGSGRRLPATCTSAGKVNISVPWVSDQSDLRMKLSDYRD